MGLKLQMSWQPSLLSHKRKNGPPLGLKNLGNSCYINSVLQCLTYTPPLANFCLNSQHSSLCDSTSDAEQKRECQFCILEKQIVRSLKLDLTLDSPAKFIRNFPDHFKFGRQEDAHEFLRCVIDACHDTCLRLKKLRRKGSDPLNGNTVVKEIFGGALQSQVKCLSCGTESNKVDEIMDISLDILNSSSLEDSIRKFFQAETLNGNNKYRCENCKKLVVARKQMSILEAPNVLVIQLKRFGGVFGGKIDKAIDFKEVLVLSNFMCKASQDSRPEYNLIGTIVHSGFSPESGHYYAYIKDAVGRWYCCNDLCVSLATRNEVLSEKVYILFFSRVNQRPDSVSTKDGSNGVKSHDINGNGIAKTQKAATQWKESKTRPHAIPSFQKDTLPSSKLRNKPSMARMKFKISGDNVPKNIHRNGNGKVGVQKNQNMVENVGVRDSSHMLKGEKDLPSSVSKIDCMTDEKAETVKRRAFSTANGNGSAHSDGKNLAKPIGHDSKYVSSNSEVEKGRDCDVQNSGKNIVNPLYVNRKPQKTSLLLAQDPKSQKKVEELKESLRQEASLVLRSCGWYDEVRSFMVSRKRLCAQNVGDTPTGGDIKKTLIAEAEPTYKRKIPESLKAGLIEKLQLFSQEKI